MMSDYYTSLTRKEIIKIPDGGGAFTITTNSTTFQGYIAYLSANKRSINQQRNIEIIAQLFTEANLKDEDKVVDQDGKEFEVVGSFNFFHRYYDLGTGQK